MGCGEYIKCPKNIKKIPKNEDKNTRHEDNINEVANSINRLNPRKEFNNINLNNPDDKINKSYQEKLTNKNKKIKNEVFNHDNKIIIQSEEDKKESNNDILRLQREEGKKVGTKIINKTKKKNKKKRSNTLKFEGEQNNIKNKEGISPDKNIKKELKKLNEEYNEKKNELDKIKRDIDKYKEDQKKLVKRNNELEKINKEIKKEEEILNQKNNELKKVSEKLKKIDDELVKKQKEIEKCDKELKQKEVELNLRKNEIKKINEDLKVKENFLLNKNNELIMKEKYLNKKELELIEKEKELNDKKNPILIGLNNIGATCYMNASLQCLSNTKKLTKYFLENYKYNPNKIMSNEYYEVIKNLWNKNNNKKSYSPYSFKDVLSKENPLFAGIAANDSKDLINFLLERFHHELNIINKDNNINNNSMNIMEDQTNEQSMLKSFLDEFKEKFNSPISNLIYGILETKSQCQGCNIIKFNFQVYSFLEFPLQQVNQFFFNKGKRPLITMDGKNPDIDLYECFEYNCKIDLMSGENQMFCNNCNRLCNAFYSTILYSGPYYLIINLNRGKGAVYECKVNFPEQLNLVNYFTYKQGVTVYELYAVICHLGPSSMSGHFVAYCRNRIDNQWYLYNDAIVTLCSKQNQYNDGMPYILFYKALVPGQDSEY